jgi:hypothetical protein
LADGNDYSIVVHTSGDTQGSYENMVNTNLGYKRTQVLDSTMDWIWISIPYASDYDFASDVADSFNTDAEFSDDTVISTVRRWNYAGQRYDTWSYIFGTWTGTDYDIEPGDALLVFVTTSGTYNWKIVGAHDPTLQFSLLVNPTITDFKMISLPYHKTYSTASDITTAHFPDNTIIDIMAQFDYTIQNWETWFYIPPWMGDDFTIYPPAADVVFFKVTKITTPALWTPQVISI